MFSLVTRSYVLALTPGNSFVERLLAAGFDSDDGNVSPEVMLQAFRSLTPLGELANSSTCWNGFGTTSTRPATAP